RALFEDRRELVDGVLQRGVMRWTADGALNLVRAIGGAAEHASEQTAGGAQGRPGYADRRRLERRHVAVVAFLAEELELISAIGGEVFVVSRESNGDHAANGSRSS